MNQTVVLLDNIRSALNVGAIFRTCDAAGVSKLILSGITPYPPHPKVLKTSLGAEEFVEFEQTKDSVETVEQLKRDKFKVLTVEQFEDSVDYREVKIKKDDKLLFIFGNEITGVSRELIELSDEIIELPMAGKKKSLNVATTVGIVLYHFQFNQ